MITHYESKNTSFSLNNEDTEEFSWCGGQNNEWPSTCLQPIPWKHVRLHSKIELRLLVTDLKIERLS